MMNLLVVLLILILLVIGGIDINPGPITPTAQLVPDKLGVSLKVVELIYFTLKMWILTIME